MYQVIASIQANLNAVKLFHIDSRKEFDNILISDAIQTFGIRQSLSKKDYPFINTMEEAIFKVFKTEFGNGDSSLNSSLLSLITVFIGLITFEFMEHLIF